MRTKQEPHAPLSESPACTTTIVKEQGCILSGAYYLLKIPADLDATSIKARELFECNRREVDAARAAAGAQVPDGGVDEPTLV